MRRICCFCETWESGGIESFLNNVLSHMDLSDMEIDIVAAHIKESVFTAGLQERGMRFVQLSGKIRTPQNHRMFRDLLKERKYDAVHFNLFQGLSLYYVQIAKEEGVPVRIAHSHNTALRKSRGRWLKMLLHRLGSALYADAATDFFACSEAAAGFLFSDETRRTKQYHFIPNGIRTEHFRFDRTVRETVRAELGLEDAFVIGNIGRLCYQKNQSFLIDLMPELLKECPHARLLLIGAGEDKEALAEQAKTLRVQKSVLFYGTTSTPEKLLCAMDVFAFPSRFEGLGIVAIEAQANGLPVVCSEFVPHEASVTTKFSSVSLRAHPSEWISALLRFRHSEIRRDDDWNEVANAGYDIHDVSAYIYRYFSGVQSI